MVKVELVAVHHGLVAVCARAAPSLFVIDVLAPPIRFHDHLHRLAVQANGRALLNLARQRFHASMRRPPRVLAAVVCFPSDVHVPGGHDASVRLTALAAGLTRLPRLPRVPARFDAPTLNGDARFAPRLTRRTLAVAAQPRLSMAPVHQFTAPPLVLQTYGAPRAVRSAGARALAADAPLSGGASTGTLLRTAGTTGFVPIPRGTAATAHHLPRATHPYVTRVTRVAI